MTQSLLNSNDCHGTGLKSWMKCLLLSWDDSTFLAFLECWAPLAVVQFIKLQYICQGWSSAILFSTVKLICHVNSLYSSFHMNCHLGFSHIWCFCINKIFGTRGMWQRLMCSYVDSPFWYGLHSCDEINGWIVQLLVLWIILYLNFNMHICRCHLVENYYSWSVSINVVKLDSSLFLLEAAIYICRFWPKVITVVSP